MPLPRHTLGRAGLQVPPQCFGTLPLSEFYGSEISRPPDLDEGRRAVERALELGVTFIDTADVYGAGHNEVLVGQLVAGRRDEVVIATKFGSLKKPGATSFGVDGRPEYVRQCCEASLRRLDVDVIDLYYQHRPDPKVPIEDTIGAMSELVAEGKVRYLGLSEASASTIRRAHAVHPISALQSEYSLFSRDIEAEIVPTCRELGIGIVAYSPLGRGLLTGAITKTTKFGEQDWRKITHPRFAEESLDYNLGLVAQIAAIARERRVTEAQVALAWLHAQGEDVVPVYSTTRAAHVESNVGALELDLRADELTVLNSLTPRGTRFPDMSGTNVDTPLPGRERDDA